MSSQSLIKIDLKNPLSIFRYVIRKLVEKKRDKEMLSHNQIAFIVFGEGDTVNQSYLSIVTNHFGSYMHRSGGKYRFDIDKISEDFPSFGSNPKRPISPIQEIEMALRSEKEAVLKQRTGRIIDVDRIDISGEDERYYFYTVRLNQQQEGVINFYEGMLIKLALDKFRISAVVLNYEETAGRLTIRVNDNITHKVKLWKRARIVIDTLWLLDKIEDSVRSINPNQFPYNKLLNQGLVPATVEAECTAYKGILDDSQLRAITHCLKYDITALWGPPGTGKTTTLGYLVLSMYLRGERTLVCSIANVAVDALAKSTLKTFHEYETTHRPLSYRNGKLLRVGFTTDNDLSNNNDLQVKSPQTRKIKRELRQIKRQLDDKTLTPNTSSSLTSRKLDLIKELEQAKNAVINKAQVVFATASMVEISKHLRSQSFDNIIVDEASMMAPPHLLALSGNVSKRVIVAGDFRQLGPIAIGQSEYSYKWLHQDLFSFMGIDYKNDDYDHPVLAKIVNQRRFHSDICKLINGSFYHYILQSKVDLKNLKLHGRAPWEDKCIVYCNMSKNRDYKIERTKEQSRANSGSSRFIVQDVIGPLQSHSLRTPFSIHIITPYRGQVANLKRELQKEISDKNFRARIRVGTIHSFQGSEADLIIFDLVESTHEKIGRLYWQQMGERLVNVAVSRATGKLIVVGDIKAITEGQGYMNVSHKVKLVLRQIAQHQVQI